MASKQQECRQTRQKSLPAIVISGLPEFMASATPETPDSDSERSISEEITTTTKRTTKKPPTDHVRFRPPPPLAAACPSPESPPEGRVLEGVSEEDQFNPSHPTPVYKKTPAFMQLSGRRRMSEYGTGATGLLNPRQKPTIRIIPLDRFTGEPGTLEEAIDGELECDDAAEGDEPPPHFSREDLDRYDGLPTWSPVANNDRRRASCSTALTGFSPLGGSGSGGEDIDEESGEIFRKRRANNRLLSVEASLGAFRPFATAVNSSNASVGGAHNSQQNRSSSIGTPPLRRIQSFGTPEKAEKSGSDENLDK